MNALAQDQIARLYKRWLVDQPMSEAKYNYLTFTDGLPIIGNYNRALFAQRDAKLYLERYGLGYSDIVNPYNMPDFNATSGVVRSAYNFVSRNIDSLYGGSNRVDRKQSRLDRWMF